MDYETRRLLIQRRDLRSGSVFDCLFGLAMVVSIATTLALSTSRDCQQLMPRFSFCVACDNRLVIWAIVAAPIYAGLALVRLKIFFQMETEDAGQVRLLLLAPSFRFWRMIRMLSSVWTMLGAIWCSPLAPNLSYCFSALNAPTPAGTTIDQNATRRQTSRGSCSLCP